MKTHTHVDDRHDPLHPSVSTPKPGGALRCTPLPIPQRRVLCSPPHCSNGPQTDQTHLLAVGVRTLRAQRRQPLTASLNRAKERISEAAARSLLRIHIHVRDMAVGLGEVEQARPARDQGSESVRALIMYDAKQVRCGYAHAIHVRNAWVVPPPVVAVHTCKHSRQRIRAERCYWGRKPNCPASARRESFAPREPYSANKAHPIPVSSGSALLICDAQFGPDWVGNSDRHLNVNTPSRTKRTMLGTKWPPSRSM